MTGSAGFTVENTGLLSPRTAEEALALIVASGGSGRLVAGATWIMRGHTRGEVLASPLIALDRIPELHGVEFGDGHCRIGAMATHDRIACAIAADAGDLAAMKIATGHSANPGIRRLATLGGNLCSTGFANADLIPALMCLDARVGVLDADGRGAFDMDAFMARRREPAPHIVTHVDFRRRRYLTAHARTPDRDYPVCIVSLALTLDELGCLSELRLAVGAVEADARRWPRFEAQALGRRPAPLEMAEIARELADEFIPASGLDAPGWYRLQVLPALVRRAFEHIATETGP
jgi:aerobic carbon-monoxide dehydrogenase medium subunit